MDFESYNFFVQCLWHNWLYLKILLISNLRIGRIYLHLTYVYTNTYLLKADYNTQKIFELLA